MPACAQQFFTTTSATSTNVCPHEERRIRCGVGLLSTVTTGVYPTVVGWRGEVLSLFSRLSVPEVEVAVSLGGGEARDTFIGVLAQGLALNTSHMINVTSKIKVAWRAFHLTAVPHFVAGGSSIVVTQHMLGICSKHSPIGPSLYCSHCVPSLTVQRHLGHVWSRITSKSH